MPDPLTPPPEAVLPEPTDGAPTPGTVLPAHYDRCFGCGPEHPSGLRMLVTVVDARSLSARFTVTEDHQGAPGLAHGGVLAAAFDEALGFLNWLYGRPAVTGRLETDFLRPVPVGTELHIAARITGVLRRKIYTAAEGRLGADGEVAVRAAGLFVVVGAEHFTTHGSGLRGSVPGAGTPYNP